MQNKSLKQQTFNGIGWSSIERFSTQGVSFVVQLILARLLTPSDYGIIGMLAIFMQLAQVIIDSGFANALIRKQNCTQRDYSTVFFYNLILSLGIYAILFISAPLVAKFFQTSTLISVMRWLTITLLFNALSIIPKSILVKTINFKKQTYISLLSALFSGILGIIFAILGKGVWALVIQQISLSICTFILYTIFVRWKLNFVFDKQIFKELFSFGSKLLLSSIIGTIYRNLYTILIGKKFSPADLGNYTRADQLAMFPSNNIGNIITRVAYPIFAKVQDDNIRLRTYYQQMIRYSSFIIFPLMIGLLTISKPFVLFFLTEKWIGAVSILQLLCVDWMLDHITLLNLNLLYVKGRSDLALKLEIIKKSIAITILLISIHWGVIGICWGRLLYSVIATIINSYYTKQLIQLSFLQQVKDFFPFVITSLVMGICVIFSTYFFDNSGIQLIIGIITGIIVYSLLSLIFFKEMIKEIRSLFLSQIKSA
jgi:O-antigen/teichoic acid export membrane protein